jgi:pimeloyl-ACP methyl ester carboxylesterase
VELVPKVRVNGVELFHELQGAGEPVVLVHGSWGDHLSWQAVVPGLAPSFRVLTYDRRGNSQSERPGDGLRRDDEDDLAALLLELDLAPAHIVGTSFGASIVLGLAARRPELFRSLAVHEPPLMAIVEDAQVLPLMAEMQKKSAAVIARLKSGDIPGGAQQFVEEVAFGPGAWGQLPDDVRQTFTNNALTWVNEQEDPDWASLDIEALGAFSSPALLSEGDQSPPWFSVIIGRLGEILTRSESHVFRGAGHAPHRSHPDEYVRTLTDFIGAVH